MHFPKVDTTDYLIHGPQEIWGNEGRTLILGSISKDITPTMLKMLMMLAAKFIEDMGANHKASEFPTEDMQAVLSHLSPFAISEMTKRAEELLKLPYGVMAVASPVQDARTVTSSTHILFTTVIRSQTCGFVTVLGTSLQKFVFICWL